MPKFTVDRDKVQKIEALLATGRCQQCGNRPIALRRSQAQHACQALRFGKGGKRTTDAIADAIEIAVRDSEVGMDLGHQQTLEVIASPPSQNGK